MASRLPFVRFDRIQHLFMLTLFIALAIVLSRPRRTRARRTFHRRTNSSLPCRRSLPLVQKRVFLLLCLRLELAGVSFASHRLTTPAIRLQHAGGDANRRGSLSTRLALFILLDFGRDEASRAKTSDAKLVPQAYAKAYTSSAAKKPIPVID